MKSKHRKFRGSVSPKLVFSLAVGCACFSSPAADETPPSLPNDPSKQLAANEDGKNRRKLTSLSVSELMTLEITTVSKKGQAVSQTPSAVFVITDEDIRRSGATSIMEALRMAPGLSVAQINANKWSITSRGFNGRFANKLLVLIDGRSVYNPLFSGIYWDSQDTVLEDVERIEVIRGPGGTIWGANAVNGVINIITKSAKDTQGGLVSVLGGNEERGVGVVRYGDQVKENIHYRVFTKFFNRDDFVDRSGDDAADETLGGRAGFRVDWEPNDQDHITFQGDWYEVRAGDSPTLSTPTFPFTRSVIEDSRYKGGHLSSTWRRTLSDEADINLQVYYDRVDRNNAILRTIHDTFDFDFFHHFRAAERHDLIYGAGYRLVMDEIDGSFSSTYIPDDRNDQIVNVFLQDEITLVEDRLKLTLGTKVEHNDYTGFEVQPSARIIWTPTEHQSLWAAVSRAVRTPSRFEHDVVANVAVPGIPAISVFNGDPHFNSEDLLAYELGYRIQPHERVSFDVALFYNEYDNLRTSEQRVVLGLPTFIIINPDNRMDGEAYGVELASQWQVTDNWRLAGGYTFQRLQLHKHRSSTHGTAETPEGDDPRHQIQLRSMLNLTKTVQLDTAAYYVDHLPNQKVPSYVRLDVRLGWQPNPNLDFSIVGQNLLDDQHPEFGSTNPLVTPTEIQRSFYGKVTWRF